MTLSRTLLSFLKNRGATAGVEFAIGAPMMLAGLIVMTDIGLAFSTQMNLDQAVRTGAGFAMGDVTDTAALEDLVGAAAAGADPDNPGDVSSDEFPTVDVVKHCECPGSTASVSCTTLCTGDIIPSAYYTLTATKNHDAIFLPDFVLTAQIRVQVR